MIRLFALALPTLASIAPAGAESFRLYANARFGATAEIPGDWRPNPPPENGDGLIFLSPDGAASILVSGILNIADTPEEAMSQEERTGADDRVTFRRRGRRTIIVSGLHGVHIFYRMSILVCHDQIWNHLDIDYPATRKAEYDSLVARVSRSFRFSGSSEQIPNCK